MTSLTHRLRRRRADQLSALRAWETACAEVNRAYAQWSAEPTPEHYRAYLTAESHAARAGQAVRQRDGSRLARRGRALTIR